MVPLRFENTFFTVVPATYGLTATEQANAAPTASDYTLADLLARIHVLQNPVPVEGNSIIYNVEDLQAEGSIKVATAKSMVNELVSLQAQDLLTATYWMNIRQIQGEKLHLNRTFGRAPTAAWAAFRKVVPWQQTNRPPVPAGTLAYNFLLAQPVSNFYAAAVNAP